MQVSKWGYGNEDQEPLGKELKYYTRFTYSLLVYFCQDYTPFLHIFCNPQVFAKAQSPILMAEPV